ncbi:MAG: hypothetical protein HKN12_08310 [Gemmatimonadetes bacterium]|nr:hypothetical protein [Gemmatimonadota bacterium]
MRTRPHTPGPRPALAIVATWALAALAATPRPAAAQDWFTLDLGTSADLKACQKTDFPERYVVGDGGFVARSAHGSVVTWSMIDVGSTADLRSVHEPLDGEVWVSGASGECRRLESAVWNGRDLPATSEVFVLFSRTGAAAYAAGSAGSVYRTTDGGMNWNLSTTAGAALHDGDGDVTGNAVCVGDAGTILATTDGGATWSPRTSGTAEHLRTYRESSGTAWCAGDNGTLLRSTDAGMTWNAVPSGTTATLYDIDVSPLDPSRVLAVGAGGTCLLSTDAGLTWCAVESGTATDLHACDLVTNTTWLVAGDGGLLRLSVTSGGGCATSAVEPVSWGRIKGTYR